MRKLTVNCYFHEDSASWPPKHELEEDNNGHVNEDRRKHQPYTKRYRQLKNAETKKILFLRKEHTNWLVTQYQIVLPENIHESNILWTRQVIFEKEQEMICGKAWREMGKRKYCNYNLREEKKKYFLKEKI